MSEILQDQLPPEMAPPVRLPGVAPMGPGDWLRVDSAFGAQMAERARLLAARRADVLRLLPEGQDAADELLGTVLGWLAAHGTGYEVRADVVQRPDGVGVPIDPGDPLGTLGQLVQEDLCLMLRPDGADEHLLVGAVLCFPASWRLKDKIGRPLTDIHVPVPEYDPGLARRVQRLFDGVQVGRPLWRFNRLAYADAALFQPVSRVPPGDTADTATHPYIRSERQTIWRLPHSRAVVFGIHTYVVARQ